MAVDTHISASPTAPASPPARTSSPSSALEDRCPPWQLHTHHWLILHGRHACVARKPHCRTCLIRDLCAFEEKHL